MIIMLERADLIQSNIRLLKRWQNAPRTKGTVNMHDEMIKYKKVKASEAKRVVKFESKVNTV